jgi:hypothetical protein
MNTPFPSLLIDEVMPTLKDTEWRLLCIIVRQTLGWQQKDTGERKTSDWLTHRQLRLRTGRASEAICKALDRLVRQGLIEIRDDLRHPLLSPHARRRYTGKLYFQLGAKLSAVSRETVNREAAKREAVRSDTDIRKIEKPFSESEIRKAKTTKETFTKRLYNGRKHSLPSPVEGSASSHPFQRAVLSRQGVALPDTGRRRTASRQATSSTSNPEVQRFLRTYRELFQQQTVLGEPPVIEWGRDGKVVQQLLRLYSSERLMHLLEMFFRSDDRWIRKTGFSLPAFKAMIGSLLINEKDVTRRWTSSSSSSPLTIHSSGWTKAASILRDQADRNLASE